MAFSFTLTTGYLNQILHARAATDGLWFDFQPTWTDLAPFGVTASGTGHAGAPLPPLDGTVLGALAPMPTNQADPAERNSLSETTRPRRTSRS